ncbi:MAG: GNAT family N-acetyltransferase [Candidatus Aenigmatarchaeota archaeon]
MFWLCPDKGNLKEDSFDFSYIKEALVQCNQNVKFIKFINDVLTSYNIKQVKTACEVGVGDVEFLVKVCREYKPKRLILIDKSKELLDYISHSVEGMSDIISLRCDFLESFEVSEIQEFIGKIDLFISTNTFHWFGRKWNLGLEATRRLLSPTGFAFIHQGLKWTYITLYELAQDLFSKAYGRRIDLDTYLYYPYPQEIESKFRFYGFSILRKKIFYEMDYLEDEEKFLRLIKSFSVAGLLPFLGEIPDINEREQFKSTFIKAAKELRPPVFSHRGFFALRKKIENDKRMSFCILTPKNNLTEKFACPEREKKLSELKALLEEVADEFVPSLFYRDANCITLSSINTKDQKTIDNYFNSIKDNFVILAQYYENTALEDSVIGALCFTIKDSPIAPNIDLFNVGEKYIYVSTIVVKKEYRGLGIAQKMYKFLFDIVKDKKILFNQRIKYLVTRTWSTNEVSKKLLSSLGFQQVKVLKDDRGKGIDTEYYVLDISNLSSL